MDFMSRHHFLRGADAADFIEHIVIPFSISCTPALECVLQCSQSKCCCFFVLYMVGEPPEINADFRLFYIDSIYSCIFRFFQCSSNR
ncbi:hypothetical protein D3C84_328690 [compost metagenome]